MRNFILLLRSSRCILQPQLTGQLRSWSWVHFAAPYLFIICLDYVLKTSIDKIRENGFKLTKKRSRRYPAKTITDTDYADDIAILANTPNQAETLQHSLERATAGIGLHVNAHKTEYKCYNQTGDISTLDGTSLKLVDKFTNLGSSVSSTEKDIDTRLTKAWTAIDRLSIIWKSDLTNKMKRSFFQAAVVSILLYGCSHSLLAVRMPPQPTWTLTKRLEKKLDGNYTRMLRAILNKSRRQHIKGHQLYGHLPPITKTIQVRRTRHAGHCWRSRDGLISDVLLWTPTYGRAKAGRTTRTYIQQLCEDTDVALKTCQRRWTIGRSRERGSGISMLVARHDDDDNCCASYASKRYFKLRQIHFILNVNCHLKFLFKLLLFGKVAVNLNLKGVKRYRQRGNVWITSTDDIFNGRSSNFDRGFLFSIRVPSILTSFQYCWRRKECRGENFCKPLSHNCIYCSQSGGKKLLLQLSILTRANNWNGICNKNKSLVMFCKLTNNDSESRWVAVFIDFFEGRHIMR